MLRFGKFFVDVVTGFVFVMSVGLLILAPLPPRRHSASTDTGGTNDPVTLTAAGHR
jgi:hypothetical protein